MEDMKIVTKMVNFIASHALSKREFKLLLKEVNSVYGSLLTYNSVQRISCGCVLDRFVACLNKTVFRGKKEHHPQLEDTHWLFKLTFFTELCSHLNELHAKLHGLQKPIHIHSAATGKRDWCYEA
jgi:hypothetical protein